MPADPKQPLTKSQLRQTLRQRRRALTPWQQTLAARKLSRHLRFHPILLHSRHLAFYLAQDGEIDPSLILRYCHKQGKCCYLPVIQNDQHLMFARYVPGQRLQPNRLGIPEPLGSPCRPAGAMDAVFMPLVGFDAEGHRLGMGGGFYDRSFAFKRQRPLFTPKLIGLAHRCQQVEALPHEAWDIDVDAILTDGGWLKF